VSRHRDSQQLEARRQAAKFLAAREAGWSDADATAYAAWRAADIEHERAAADLEATDARLRQLTSATSAADLLAEAEALANPHASHRSMSGWLQVAWPFAIAATLIFGFAVVRPRHGDPAAVVATQARMLDLSDGSTLRLESGSEVAVQFRREIRRIELRQGAAHFAVAKDAGRPFVVAAGNVEVRALGTAFDVRYRPTEVEVIVTEGKVAVTHGAATSGEGPLFLVAGERTTVARQTPSVVAAKSGSSGDAEVVTRTHAPRLEFSDTPLADVVSQFNRYSRTQLEIADADLASRPVGGTFDADRADVFVDLLASSGDIRIERVSETHVVLRKAR